MAEPEKEAGGRSSDGGKDEMLPRTNVTRIMRKALPAGTEIAEVVQKMVQKSATEFIHLITSEASHKCLKIDNRKSLNGDDIIHSVKLFGFHDLGRALQEYLDKYRQMEMERKYQNVDDLAEDQNNKRGDDAETTGDNPDGMGAEQKIIDDEEDPNLREAEPKRRRLTRPNEYDADDVIQWLNGDSK